MSHIFYVVMLLELWCFEDNVLARVVEKLWLSKCTDWLQWVNAEMPNVAHSFQDTEGEDSAGCEFPSQFTSSAHGNVNPKCVRAVSHHNTYRACWFSGISSLCPHTREWNMEKNTAHWVWDWDWYCLLVFTPYCWFPPLQTGLGFTTQGGSVNRQQKLIMKREAVQMEQKISSGSGKSSFSSQFSYNCCIVLYGEELC